MDVAMLSGSMSTAVFVGSALPMLVKALRTREVSSYSRGHLVLASIGNALYSVYVVSLPVGPLWFLHLFNVLTTGSMLALHLRYAGRLPGTTPATPAGAAARRWRRRRPAAPASRPGHRPR